MLAKKLKQDNICKYCDKAFHQAKTLATHICVKKRRYMETDTAGSRFGLRAFQRFYELTAQSKKLKSLDDFINSPYYIDFAKFGNHLALLKPIYMDKYIDYVILNGVKLKDWAKDSVYELYIEDLIKKEPAESATERTITEIINWCNNNNVVFGEFFSKIHPNEAASLIKRGRISPWVLYLANSGEHLMVKFSEDHSKMIGNMIDPGFWMKKFKKSTADVDFIRSLLEQSGL